ncbi:hypothetical protein SESBI_39921 [Sesbania bispinosa]|nr:hypothetical protein SESBI_39921 [Sesbania bispinosa]
MPSQDQNKDSVHGEWLVVTRTKKQNSNRNKGKSMGKISVESAKKVSEDAKTTVVNSERGNLASQGLTFNSKALPSSTKTNERKKRLRNEDSQKSDQSIRNQAGTPKTNLRVSLSKSKVEGISAPGVSNHGIQTTWNVDIISANRLRFRDVDNPEFEMGMVSGHDHSEGTHVDREVEAMDDEESALKNISSRSCT